MLAELSTMQHNVMPQSRCMVYVGERRTSKQIEKLKTLISCHKT